MAPCSTLFRCIAVTLLIPVSSAVIAQDTLWGLHQNDRFSIETTIARQTTIRIDDGDPVETKQTDRLEVEYTVQKASPTQTSFFVHVTQVKMDDTTPLTPAHEQYIRGLRQSPMSVLIDDKGVVRNHTGYHELMKRIGGLDDGASRLVAEAYPEPVFLSWIGRPFWLVPAGELAEEAGDWERVDNVTLGLMGMLRTITTCKVDGVDGTAVSLAIDGESRHVAPVATARTSQRLIRFSDISADVKSFHGNGRLIKPVAEPDRNPDAEPNDGDEKDNDDDSSQPRVSLRPWFEELALSWEIQGTAKMTAGTRTVDVSFRQSQVQTSQLMPGYLVKGKPGRPGIRRFSPPPF